jgi:transcriptional regulator with XRE-family HTH domain
MTILLREAIGDRLRHARTTKQCTLRDISRAARVSLGYLSEVERGQKEASSELLAAICDALGLSLSQLLATVASDMGMMEGLEGAAKADSFETGLPESVTVGDRLGVGRAAGASAHTEAHAADLGGASLLSEVGAVGVPDASNLAEAPLPDCLPPHFTAPWSYSPLAGAHRRVGVATGVTAAA